MSDHRRPLKEAGSEDSFLIRWSRRKLGQADEQHDLPATTPAPSTPEEPVLQEEDMPPLESLTSDSDYSGFLSPGVSESLRRLALRKLFHAPEFNLCDGLDDYDDDFRTFAELGSLVTVEMRKRLEGVLEEKGTAAVDADALADTAREAPMAEEPRDEEPDDEELDEELG